MKKLLDSDWLTAVQFKCNASANLDYNWLKDNRKFCVGEAPRLLENLTRVN